MKGHRCVFTSVCQQTLTTDHWPLTWHISSYFCFSFQPQIKLDLILLHNVPRISVNNSSMHVTKKFVLIIYYHKLIWLTLFTIQLMNFCSFNISFHAEMHHITDVKSFVSVWFGPCAVLLHVNSRNESVVGKIGLQRHLLLIYKRDSHMLGLIHETQVEFWVNCF